MLSVVFRGFVRVMRGMQAVCMRDVGMMAGLVMVARLVMLGSFAMMMGGSFMMFGRGLMMVAALMSRLCGHDVLLSVALCRQQ